jgi:histidinol-phosphatase
VTTDGTELKALLNFALETAREAGAITYRHFKGSFEAEGKSDNSFVTIADREADEYLRSEKLRGSCS